MKRIRRNIDYRTLARKAILLKDPSAQEEFARLVRLKPDEVTDAARSYLEQVLTEKLFEDTLTEVANDKSAMSYSDNVGRNEWIWAKFGNATAVNGALVDQPIPAPPADFYNEDYYVVSSEDAELKIDLGEVFDRLADKIGVPRSLGRTIAELLDRVSVFKVSYWGMENLFWEPSPGRVEAYGPRRRQEGSCISCGDTASPPHWGPNDGPYCGDCIGEHDHIGQCPTEDGPGRLSATQQREILAIATEQFQNYRDLNIVEEHGGIFLIDNDTGRTWSVHEAEPGGWSFEVL